MWTLLREGWKHSKVSKVLNIVVGCSLGWISRYGQHVLQTHRGSIFFSAKQVKGSPTHFGYLPLPGRLLSDLGWGVCAVLQWAGSDAGSAIGTTPHWDDPGTEFHSDCSPRTHLKTYHFTVIYTVRVNFTKNVQAVKINESLPNAVLRFVSPE